MVQMYSECNSEWMRESILLLNDYSLCLCCFSNSAISFSDAGNI